VVNIEEVSKCRPTR